MPARYLFNEPLTTVFVVICPILCYNYKNEKVLKYSLGSTNLFLYGIIFTNEKGRYYKMTFDVFISHKSSDRKIALRIYNELKRINPDISIFLSEITLKEIGKSDYTPAIENAIKNSRNMLVLATNHENFLSKWVNFEWRLFHHFQLNDRDNFHHNLITVTPNIDYSMLPDALQLCENIKTDDYETMYKYIMNSGHEEIVKKAEERKSLFLETALQKAGWGNAIIFSSKQLSVYEGSITDSLKSVTIISHTLEEDSPGGALFETVEKNLVSGIKYNYLFLDAQNARSILKKIYTNHSVNAQKNLYIEKTDESFWVLGSYANVTIYEYKDRSTEGFFRIKIETVKDTYKSIFIRLSEQIVERIENQIEKYREEGKISIHSYTE